MFQQQFLQLITTFTQTTSKKHVFI